MGKLGRAIDALPDDAKDVIVRSHEWRTGDLFRGDLETEDEILGEGPACFAGWIVRAFAQTGDGLSVEEKATFGGGAGRGGLGVKKTVSPKGNEGEFRRYCRNTGLTSIGPHFDALCERFGQDRIVRLIKQRAAATMSGEVEEQPETVPAE